MTALKATGRLPVMLGGAVRNLFPYVWVVVQRELDSLYILQLERYSPARFARWLGGNRRTLVPGWEVATQIGVVAAACLLAVKGIPWLVAYALWLAAGHLARRRQRSLQVSQRLQFTSRTVRVSAAVFALSGVLVAGAVVTASLAFPVPGLSARLVAGGIVGFALAGFVAPLLVWLAGSLLLPVERRIFHGYLGEADRRMRRYPGRVVGITGSYGKTTTKFILAHLLEGRYRTFKTPDGVNTTMGITRIIREELRDDHEVFVVEMAAYGPGEIREVCDLVHPTLGILTAVGVQHLERFGTPERIADAKYELVTRGTYSATNAHIQDAIFGIDSKTPLELFEARNAVRIAHIALADKYAPSILSKAGQQLLNAESLYRQKQNKANVVAAAKEATQTAEEARVMAVKQKAEDDAQAAAAAREAKARADADAEARRRAEAEAARQAADEARAQAEQAKAEAERMKQEALAAAQEAARQKEEAEKAKAEAVAQQQALAADAAQAHADAQKAEGLRQQAEREKQELRERLLQQLNSILATRDSARGLVANMSDVLFRSGSYELAPGARERLAKVSGIILAYPSLHVSVEGHTDSVGGDEYNQSLSELRAQSVRDYFVQQGIASSSIESHGYGKTQPIASNDSPEGRQQNRRVELVLSGDAIGSQFDTTPSGPATSAATPRQ